MTTVYLDKKERVRAWLSPPRVVALSAAFVSVLCLPVWPDFVAGQFVLLPARTAVVRATVPGIVASVAVREGEPVLAGASLARMRNLDLESRSAEAQRQLSEATAQTVKAALRYAGLGAAEQERQRQITNNRLSQERTAQLSIASPIAGIVATPHLEDLVGRSLDEGDLILQVADTSEMKAQIYIPEFAMRDVHLGEKVRLLATGQVMPTTAILSQLSPSSTPIADGFLLKDQLQGINPPRYFVGTVLLKNNGELLLGAAGSAKVLVGRRSLAGFCLRFSRELVDRKLW